MRNEREMECIRIISAFRVADKEAKLAKREADLPTTPFGIIKSIKWSKSPPKAVIQCLMLPFAFVLILVIWCILLPLYISRHRRVSSGIKSLRTEIDLLRAGVPSVGPSGNRTLGELWATHGPKRCEQIDSLRTQILCKWIDILYGNGTADRCRIKERIAAIEQRQQDARQASYDRGVIIDFVDPINWLVAQEVSKELGPYE